jgi:sugar phosphate isomerase/epimerase
VKIGIALWNLKAKNLTEKTRKVLDLKFNAISFLNDYFGTKNINTISKKEKEAIIKAIKDNNLCVTFHMSLFGLKKDKLIKDLESKLNNIQKFIKEGKLERNIWNISFDPLVDFKGKRDPKNYKFNFKGTVKVLKYTLKKCKNINISIENWLVDAHIDILKRIKKAVNNKRLRMLLDVAHINLALKNNAAGRNNFSDYIKDLPLKIVELHIHDNDGKTDLHLPVGKGNIDYPDIIKVLKKSGKMLKDAVFTLEIVPNFKPLSIYDKQDMKDIYNSRKILKENI